MAWHMQQMGTGAWLYLIILILFFVVAAIYLIKQQKDHAEDAEDEPMDILKKRYARGEITRQEYEEIKKSLAQE